MIIANYKPIGKGSLLGAFDLDTPAGFKFPGTLLMEKDGRMWISFPGIPYDSNGKKGYKRRDKFNEQVLEALRAGGFIQ